MKLTRRSSAAGSLVFPSHGKGHRSKSYDLKSHPSTVMVVESPTKAKKIAQFLGPSYRVLASYGHIRDLPPKTGSVLPPTSADDMDEAAGEAGWSMKWEMSKRASPRLEEIEKAVMEARKASPNDCRLILATDPDREGEAISWHLMQAMQENGTLGPLLKSKKGKASRSKGAIKVERVVFHEITKKAVEKALTTPREVSQPLVDAYLARRALDYLVGFHISPVLWRRLPGARSAGRVQSVALRLVSAREDEIDAFAPTEYWSIESVLMSAKGEEISAKLTQVDGSKVTEMGIRSRSEADALVERLKRAETPIRVEEEPNIKQVHRKPPPPFTTSSMQQEASKKLGFNATRTMKAAQELYEGAGSGEGLISYHRSDGVQMSPEALEEVREEVTGTLGKEYVSSSIRVYKAKAKNAQEAHEAIRPIRPHKAPDSLTQVIAGDLLSLYDLIWRRTLASQMSDSTSEQVSVLFASEGLTFKASGNTLTFPGFLKVLSPSLLEDEPGREEEAGGEEGDSAGAQSSNKSRALSLLKKGDALKLVRVVANQHFTRPPPRFTDASLIKAMEELGIGRPSTYATVLNVLSSRGYVTREGRALVPCGLGRVLTSFLIEYFPKYVDYGFTSGIEEQLDEVSDGKLDWEQGVLSPFWSPFHSSVQSVMKNTSTTAVFDMLDARLGPYLFRKGVDEGTGDGQDAAHPVTSRDPRQCPLCKDGRLSLKPSSQGGFIGCSNYATKGCRFGRPLIFSQPTGDHGEEDLLGTMVQEGQEVGIHPETGLPLVIKSGPYGLFIEEVLALEATPEADASSDGEGKKKKGKSKKPKPPKPRRATLPKELQPSEVNLTMAVALLALPKVVGNHPADGLPVSVNTGRFGPYAAHNGSFASLSSFLKSFRGHGDGEGDERSMAEILIKDVSLEDAVRLVDAKREKVKGREAKAKQLVEAKGRKKSSSGVKETKGKAKKTEPLVEVVPKQKRTPSGYQNFLKAEFAATKASLQQESSEVVTMGLVSAALGRRWKEMSEEDKARYR